MRQKIIVKHVEKEVPDDVDANYHLGRLMKIISIIFFLFLAVVAMLPHVCESIDGKPVVQFWLLFSLVIVPAALFALERFKKMIKP